MKTALRPLFAASFASLAFVQGCTIFGPGNSSNPNIIGARPTGYVYTTLFSKNAVLEINSVQSRVEHEPITVPNGPRALAIDPRDRNLYLYVVCELGNTVAVIDRRNRQITRTISVGNRPYSMAITPAGTRGFITNQDDDTVTVLDIATNTVLQTVPLRNISTNTGAPTPAPGTVGSTPTKLSPRGVATSADGKFVYVACAGGAVCILTGNPGVSTTPAAGTETGTTPVSTSGAYTLQRTVLLPQSVQPQNIAVASPAGAAGTTTSNDTVYITDPLANRVFFFQGQAANEARAVDILGSPYDVAVGKNPTTGNPDSVYVTLENLDGVKVFDTNMGERSSARTIGRQPQFVEVSSLGTEVYVSLSGSNNVALFGRQGQELVTPEVFNLQQLNPAFIAPTGDIALGGFLFN